MASIAFSFQRYFEYQIEEAKTVSDGRCAVAGRQPCSVHKGGPVLQALDARWPAVAASSAGARSAA